MGDVGEPRTSRLRILIAHNRYRSASPGGEDRVVDQESLVLARAGHRVRRLERANDDIDHFSIAKKAVIPGQVLWSKSSAKILAQVLDDFEPDVVHVHNLFPLLSPSVLLLCRQRGIPVVATIHNYRLICSEGSLFRAGAICKECVGRSPLPAIRYGCFHGNRLATVPLALASVAHKHVWRSMVSAYIFVSTAQKQEFVSLKLPEHRCFVKSNLALPAVPKTTTEDLVVFAGRLNEAKGLPVLMKAWDRFSTKHIRPQLRLAIAGSGPLEPEVRSWAQSRPQVEFYGLQTRDQCAALMSRARAVLVPSQWPEVFGLVVAEAMAAGVAPIASAHGSFPELITDGFDGLLFPAGDVQALSEVLDRVYEAPAWFDQLGRNALQTFRRRFHPDANTELLEKIYGFAMNCPIGQEHMDKGAGSNKMVERLPREGPCQDEHMFTIEPR